jgi:ABC-2 type transport system permease protein
MKKVYGVFQRDLKISVKDPMALWMILMPLILALIILWIAPGITESVPSLAVDQNLDSSFVQALSKYADVETLADSEAVRERVLRRDTVIGLIAGENGPVLVQQGNETASTISTARLLAALAGQGEAGEPADASFGFYSFRDPTSPLKRALSISLLIMISVITSMLISLGLVDEKTDQTIRAANVTPMPQALYVLSKSSIGVITLIVTSAGALWILGITAINWGQMLLLIFADGLISIIVAFVIGLASTDFIEAAGSVKLLFLPLAASVLVYELTDPAWHFTVMWSPFYWAYRGITEVVQGTSGWGSTLLYTAIIALLSGIVFLLCLKNIRRSLQ